MILRDINMGIIKEMPIYTDKIINPANINRPDRVLRPKKLFRFNVK